MIIKTLQHIRNNAIAYVALVFAIGGGGTGVAIAATATSSPTIHACVSKKSHAVYIAKRCGKTTKALTFNQRGPTGATGPAGTPAVQAFGQVEAFNGQAVVSQGLTIQNTSAGVYSVTVTAPACKGLAAVPTVTAEPAGIQQGGTTFPVATVDGSGAPFVVTVGVLSSGTVTLSNQPGFTIQVECGAASS